MKWLSKHRILNKLLFVSSLPVLLSVSFQALGIEATQGRLAHSPNEIGHLITDTKATHKSVFKFGPFSPLGMYWIKTNNKLKKKLNLDIGIAYTPLVQKTSAGGGE
jgi:hypothetical protein